MNSAYLTVILVAAAVVALFATMIAVRTREYRAEQKKRIKERWGKSMPHQFSAEEISGIRAYSDSLVKPAIDDITAHDIDLDRVFGTIPKPYSSAGQEVLYAWLRHPETTVEVLEERNRLAELFAGDEELRGLLLPVLDETGYLKHTSFYESLRMLKGAKPIGRARFAVLGAATLLAVVLLFIVPLPAVIALVILMALDFRVHLGMKNRTEPYIRGFQCVLRLLKAADRLIDLHAEGLTAYADELDRLRNAFSSFRKGAFWVTSGSRAGTGLDDAVLEYLKMFFHTDLIQFDRMLVSMRDHEDDAVRLFELIGTLDAASSVASYRAARTVWCHAERISWEEESTQRNVVENTKENAGESAKENAGENAKENAGENAKESAGENAKENAGENAKESEGESAKEHTKKEKEAEIRSGQKPPAGQKEVHVSIHIEEMVHPLLTGAVPNSIDTDKGILLTGSNASGKSTFLKTVALCALLGQSIDTVPAKVYRAPCFRIYTSMALSDNLSGGESYFVVELRSLKRICDDVEHGDVPVLAIVDEVLRGTNTIERIAASSGILENLERPNALVFAATHDRELSDLLEGIYRNMHFEEQIEDGDVRFDYRLREGRSETTNAIRLLESFGYDPEVVRKARIRADGFSKTGVWSRSENKDLD